MKLIVLLTLVFTLLSPSAFASVSLNLRPAGSDCSHNDCQNFTFGKDVGLLLNSGIGSDPKGLSVRFDRPGFGGTSDYQVPARVLNAAEISAGELTNLITSNIKSTANVLIILEIGDSQTTASGIKIGIH